MNKGLDKFKSIFFIFLYLGIFVVNTRIVNRFISEEYTNLIMLTVIPLAIYYIIFRIRKKDIWQFCNFKMLRGRRLLLCISLGISISLSMLLFMKIPVVEKSMPGLEAFFSGFDNGPILKFLLFSFLIYTTAEEVLFRGLIFNELKGIFSVSVSVIIQALLYVFMQSDIAAVIFGIISYLIYCIVYVWCDSIWSSIVVLYTSHAFILLTRRAGIMECLSQISPVLLSAASIICIMLTLFIMYSMYRYRNIIKY